MSMLNIALIYLITGSVSGLMSGLFGIGGGLVMVPALLWCFQATGMPLGVIPAAALGTSLTVICFTSAIAAREHSRLGNLRDPLSLQMMVLVAMLALGVIAGTEISTHLPRRTVTLLIATFEVTVGCWMFYTTVRVPSAGSRGPDDSAALPSQERLRSKWSSPFMLLTGAVSAVGGIGGATLMIPYFTRRGIDYPRAAALSTFFGSVIGGFGFVSYALLAHPAREIPASVGYVNLPAALCMGVGGYFLTRHGARLSTRVAKKTLTRGFSCFLLVSGGKALVITAVSTL